MTFRGDTDKRGILQCGIMQKLFHKTSLRISPQSNVRLNSIFCISAILQQGPEDSTVEKSQIW